MLEVLNDREKDVVRRALLAAADGPFFPEWEFHTIFGLDRQDVRDVANSWPDLSVENQTHVLAVNNSLNNLTGYPIKPIERLADYDLDQSEMLSVFERVSVGWRKERKSNGAR